MIVSCGISTILKSTFVRSKVTSHRPIHGPPAFAPQSHYTSTRAQGTLQTIPCQNPLNASISSLYYTLATVALACDTVASHTTHTRTHLNIPNLELPLCRLINPQDLEPSSVVIIGGTKSYIPH